jgi:carbamate kinase
VKVLLGAGVLVVCAGGGGIPVVVDPEGALRGVEAVIDKDRTAALLAEAIGADALLLLTDVSAVWTPWRDPAGRAIRTATPSALRAISFAPSGQGSIGPKVEAACDFVERSGRFAAIGALEDASAILLGRAGTRVRAGQTSGDRMDLHDAGALARPW